MLGLPCPTCGETMDLVTLAPYTHGLRSPKPVPKWVCYSPSCQVPPPPPGSMNLADR